jgi:C1A family cysteine protease
MKSVVALVALLSLAAGFSQLEYETAFTKWMVENGKSYAPEEFFYRFEVFKSNMDFVEAFNAANHTSTVGLNKFADLTTGEFKLVYLGLKPELRREKKYVTLQDLPQSYPSGSLDWTTKGVVTPVKDQGQCGSCWAFSTTGSVEGTVALTHGVLISLSEQELVDCAGKYGNYGCNGGLMDNAFQYVMANGLLTEQQYPYTARDGICQRGSQAASQYSKISSYKDVAHTEDALGASDDIEPVSVAIEADQASFQLYTGGVLTANCGQNLDHGVLLVGYGTTTDGSNLPYWKVKNSWGTSWGEAGYIRIERGLDLCGIANEPSYPVD